MAVASCGEVCNSLGYDSNDLVNSDFDNPDPINDQREAWPQDQRSVSDFCQGDAGCMETLDRLDANTQADKNFGRGESITESRNIMAHQGAQIRHTFNEHVTADNTSLALGALSLACIFCRGATYVFVASTAADGYSAISNYSDPGNLAMDSVQIIEGTTTNAVNNHIKNSPIPKKYKIPLMLYNGTKSFSINNYINSLQNSIKQEASINVDRQETKD